jgi:hypothetical protein
MRTTLGEFQHGVTLLEGPVKSGKTRMLALLATEMLADPTHVTKIHLYGDLQELRHRISGIQSHVADRELVLLDRRNFLQEALVGALTGEVFLIDDITEVAPKATFANYMNTLHHRAMEAGIYVVGAYDLFGLDSRYQKPRMPTFKLLGSAPKSPAPEKPEGTPRSVRGKTHFPCMPGDTIIERVFPQPPPGGKAVLSGCIVSAGPGGVECGTFEAYSLELHRVQPTGERSNLLLSNAWCLAFEDGEFSQHDLSLHEPSAVFQGGDHLEMKVVSASMDLHGQGFEVHYAWEIYE